MLYGAYVGVEYTSDKLIGVKVLSQRGKGGRGVRDKSCLRLPGMQTPRKECKFSGTFTWHLHRLGSQPVFVDDLSDTHGNTIYDEFCVASSFPL
jgi:hypothetical protein